MVGPAPSSAAERPRSRRWSAQYWTLTWSVSGSTSDIRLIMAVAKKRVPSAPVRSLCRRIVREACRAYFKKSPKEDGGVLRFHLHSLPLSQCLSECDEQGRPRRTWERRLTDRALKRALRSDADRLLQRIAQGLAVRRDPHG